MTDKYKILTISDHPLISSGVGNQTKYIIEALLATGRYKFVSLGGAIKHKDYRPQKLKQWEDDWIIFPINGYGDENLIRQMLDAEKPDALWFMTDPRFYGWLFNMSDEIKDRNIPMLYYHVWDNYPVPVYNKNSYECCSFVGCISKLTHDILCKVGMEEHSAYIPHAVEADVFKQFSEEEVLKHRQEGLGKNKDKFVLFYNSRNARRKMTADIMKQYKMFLDEVGHDKAFLLMHTDPHDKEGSNLVLVAQMLGLNKDQVAFSNGRVSSEQLATYYNVADITVNLSNNEGFGLSCLESLSCGTPVVINKTGGLQDQPIDDKGNIFGVMVEPATKSIQGSQEIPYIFDDRCADKDVVEAFKTMFNMTREERRALGKQAREWTLTAFSLKRLAESWDQALTKYIETFKKEGYPNRIRFTEI